MGEVWLASFKGAAGFEKVVAVKSLHPRFSSDADRTKGLLREAMLGVSLEHENVVQVFDLGEDDGRYFVAMEYVRGHSLAHVLQYLTKTGESMPVRHAAHVVRRLCRALEYVHRFEGGTGESLGLVHGDVSPSNVLMAADGRIKLSDFGVAAMGATEDAAVVGKLAYLPPEVLGGAGREQAWDVYAASCVLLVSLGSHGTQKTAMEAVRLASRGQIDAALGRDDVAASLRDLIVRGISPRPERRFGSARELRKALEQALPRELGDADEYASWISGMYASAAFVASHGELPTTGSFSAEVEMSPFLAETMAVSEPSTMKVRRARPLRFGLSPASGPERAREVGAQIAEVFGSALGREIVPVVLGDYQALVDTLSSSEVDLAWMPPVSYLRAWELGVSVLVATVRQGKTAYESALVVRADSSFETVHDLRGKSAAWVGRDSASGYLFAAALLAAELGRLDVGREHFFGSHRVVCEAVANGWADFGATYATRDAEGKLISCGWWDSLDSPEQLRPIAYSEPIPGDNIACKPAMSTRLQEELREMLVGLRGEPRGRELLSEVFHAEGFEVVERDFYEPAHAVLEALSLKNRS